MFGECSAGDPDGVRLDLAHLLPASTRAQPGDAVRAAPALELVEARRARPSAVATISLPVRCAVIPRSSQ